MTFDVTPWIPHLLLVGSTLLIVGMLFLFRITARGRRSPLTRDLLRSPGESLRAKIDDLGDNLSMYVALSLMFPMMVLAVYSLQAISKGTSDGWQGFFIVLLLGMGYFLFKMWHVIKQRINLQLALDCELAVGQELNHLMLNGCRVYHDFPAEKFNIDHVVVGPKGVFAVETKGRAKPDKKGGTEEATVTYDRGKLNFPGWSERDLLDQAKRQATWLSKWLSSAVGEQVSVQAVLALPGWFIDRTKPSPDLIIFNGKNPDLLLKWVTSTPLSETLMQRVAHQLEQHCRDVEPAAYKKGTGYFTK